MSCSRFCRNYVKLLSLFLYPLNENISKSEMFLCDIEEAQEDRSSHSPVVTGICGS